jgi:putative addiction module component (TIGR02574 family)
MTPSLQDLKEASSSLPAPQRAELAHYLLRSLEPEEDGWADSWHAELIHRLTEIRSGQVAGVPAQQVIDRLRERYP